MTDGERAQRQCELTLWFLFKLGVVSGVVVRFKWVLNIRLVDWVVSGEMKR